MQVELLTKEDLKQFKAELVQELKGAFGRGAKPPNKEWLKSSEVRKLPGISPGTLQNLRINGTLTYSKIGGIMYYRYQDIMKLLEKGGVK
ncbi:helix-turn-helix domain-containing protein [uncultured Mucilaginibacter sp.]|uniref:helix-turn-helix domain-containing protein n=1 Tax=uncultured Mucilaginibacter sp. TaxID=797541 RepID=UPI00262D1BE4|nr:helix-turn-helix domain-containing protein [uncultured Mucilaginibacter sp.]